MSARETSADGLLVGTGVGTDNVSHWRKVLAAFIAQSSAALAHPYFYTIRTNTKWSLCLLSGLSTTIYSTLLLKCDLVEIRTSRDGSKSIRLAREKWIGFINQYHGLQGDAEYTDGGIKRGAIFDDLDGAAAAGMIPKFPLLCVGKVRPGKSPPSNTAINRGDEPPRISHTMRDVKMNLIECTMSLMLVVDDAKREDVSAVEQWIMMKKNPEAKDTSPIKLTRNPDPESQDQAPTPPTPSASSDVCGQFSPFSRPDCIDHTQSAPAQVSPDKFPGLVRLSPDLHVLQRGQGMCNGVDLNMVHFQQVIKDCYTYCKETGEALQFMHSNGQHGVRLVELPIERLEKGRLNPNLSRCLHAMLSVCKEYCDVDGDVEDDIFEHLIDYLLKRNREKMLFRLREHQLIPKILNEYNLAALLSESGIKLWQWRKISQCLRLFMDVKQIAVSEKQLRMLGSDHGEIKHGVYYYSDPQKPTKVKEKVEYWTKDPAFEFTQLLQGIIGGRSIDPKVIKSINIVHGGDHGKEKFRFCSKLLIYMNNGDCHSEVFGLADIKCHKDHAQILDHTCMPEMIKGVNLIERSQVVFTLEPVDGKNKKTILSLSDATLSDGETYHTIKPVTYIAGDLAFLSYLMGKDNFSSSWCNWCKISSSVWKTPPSNTSVNDLLWSVKRVKEQVSTNEMNGYSDERRMGVCNLPKFTIPFECILFSGLHASIGIGGVFVHKLEEFIDVDVEHISAEEFQLRETKSSASIQIDLLREDKKILE